MLSDSSASADSENLLMGSGRFLSCGVLMVPDSMAKTTSATSNSKKIKEPCGER